jgi:hypothetical protein
VVADDSDTMQNDGVCGLQAIEANAISEHEVETERKHGTKEAKRN